MADILEGTSEFNRGHQLVTGEIPVVRDRDLPPGQAYLIHQSYLRNDPMHDDDPAPTVTNINSTVDMFKGPKLGILDDDTPIAATCNTENPEACEACD